MKKILTRIFAFIGFLVVCSFTTGLLIGFIFTPRPAEIPEKTVIFIDFSAPFGESNDDVLDALAPRDRLGELLALVRGIERVAEDTRVAGLIADVSDAALTPAESEEVRTALAKVRAAGKFTSAFADSFGELGPGNGPYWLASAFEQIWLQPLGTLGLTGGALSLPFARDALDKLGVSADMRQRYEYKGAADALTHNRLPAPLAENYGQLLADLHQHLLTDVSTARRIPMPELKQLVDEAPLLGARAKAAGLIDQLDYRDKWQAAALTTAELTLEELMPFPAYLAALEPDERETKARVAFIPVQGPIVRKDGESGPMGGHDSASAQAIVQAIDAARADDSISAILLRIDSPGGSVTASESIYRALMQARERGMFVTVSMGATAASGGYWIAAAAQKILANASTITGSIGVVGGKIVFGDLMDKLGIRWAELGTGANSTMYSALQPFTPAQAQQVDAALDEIYTAFTQKVSTARGLDTAQIDKVARGRVWSGARAKELGLVDDIGGLRAAITATKLQLGLSEQDAIELVLLPAPPTLTERLFKLAERFALAPHISLGSLLRELHSSASTLTRSPLLYTGPQVMDN